MPYRCAILDDEPLAVELLSSYLDQTDELELVITMDTMEDAERLVADNRIDLIFLDMNIRGIHELTINQLLQKKNAIS